MKRQLLIKFLCQNFCQWTEYTDIIQLKFRGYRLLQIVGRLVEDDFLNGSLLFVILFWSCGGYLVLRFGYCVLLNYFHGDAIFSRCIAVIIALFTPESCLHGCVFTVTFASTRAIPTVYMTHLFLKYKKVSRKQLWYLNYPLKYESSRTVSATLSIICTRKWNMWLERWSEHQSTKDRSKELW